MGPVYLIPTVLADDAFEGLPAYILPTIKNCQVIFAENERTARRFLKSLDRSIVIDQFEWYSIHQVEEEQLQTFTQKLKEDKTVAIISEAGCPGIADPGQLLVAKAQQLGAKVHPLVGPSSILLALMASGMNGQHFEFVGYLPVEAQGRNRAIRELEAASRRTGSTKIFIETPYRNDQLMESLLQVCNDDTRICVAANLTAADEWIRTQTVSTWKNKKPALHKKPVIFLLSSP